MDSSIRQRLLQAEDDLLDAVIGERVTMDTFAESWTSLYADVVTAIEAELLDEDTKQLAHATASRVRIIAESFLDFCSQADAMAVALEKSLETMLSSMTISKDKEDTTIHDSLSATPDPPMRAVTSYIISAYEWLLRNLHNPYPTKHVKETIARETGSPIKDLDNWFIDARRRIGWNQLRRKRFLNKRQEIVRAATKFFASAGCAEPLDLDTEMEFAAIKEAALGLYANKFASRLEPVQCARDGLKKPKPSNCRRGTCCDKPNAQPYPSRELTIHSIASSSRAHNSRKRRLDHDTVDSEPETVTSLTSRKQSKLNHDSGSQQSEIPIASPSTIALTRQPVKRKRELSQSEDHPGSAKRLCSAPGPRTHTVSGPSFYDVSLDTSALDAWLQTNWSITQPFDITFNESDQDNLRLELFNPSESVFPVLDTLPQTNELPDFVTSKASNSFVKPNAVPELYASSIASTSSSPSSQTNIIPSTDSTSNFDHWADSSHVSTMMQNLSWLLNVDVTDQLLPPLWEENLSVGILKDQNTLFNLDIPTCEFPQVDLGPTSTICS